MARYRKCAQQVKRKDEQKHSRTKTRPCHQPENTMFFVYVETPSCTGEHKCVIPNSFAKPLERTLHIVRSENIQRCENSNKLSHEAQSSKTFPIASLGSLFRGATQSVQGGGGVISGDVGCLMTSGCSYCTIDRTEKVCCRPSPRFWVICPMLRRALI